MALFVDQHIFGLDIEMKHPTGMSNLKRFCHRFEYGRYNIGIHFVGVHVQHFGKSHAIDILQDEVRHAILHFEVVHLNDGRIRELCCSTSLFQSRHRRSVDGTLPQKDAPALGEHFSSLFKGHAFYGNSALYARIPCNLHRSKATVASLPFQAITSQQQVFLAGRLLSVLWLRTMHQPIVAQRRIGIRSVGDVAVQGRRKPGWQSKPANAACFWCFALGLLQALFLEALYEMLN